MKLPERPVPTEKVTDYDDGDPYSCMAAGRAEYDQQITLKKRVFDCFGRDPEQLDRLVAQDAASVRTALYDLWLQHRPQPVAAWAAQQMQRLGNSELVDYDQAH